MRIFDSIIHTNDTDYEEEIETLSDRLEQGTNILEVLQNPPDPSSEEAKLAKALDVNLQEELEHIVEDITMALLGKEININN